MSENHIEQPLPKVRQTAAWYTELTPQHWRTLWGSYLGWIFDGFEAFALVVSLPFALKSLLSADQMPSSQFYAGLAIGITLLGWGIGGLIGGVMCDYIGRKRMMMLSIFFYALFTGLTAFSTSFEMLIFMRFITGLAIGSEWSTGIALVSETWPDRARPKGCGFLQSGFGAGALLASIVWLALTIFQPMGTESWRLVFAIGALPAFCVLYLRRSMEESEKWAEAVKAERASSGTGQRPFTLAEIFREPTSRRRVLLTTLLAFATTVGWWAVSSWLPAYTEQLARLNGEPAGVWGPRMSIIYNVGAIFAYVVSGFLADAIGRRAYLLFTFAGSLAMSILSYMWQGDLVTFMAIAFFNGVFTLGFAFSWMAIYLVELFATPVRATAASFIFNASRLVAWVFPIIAGAIVVSLGGLSNAALTMASVFVIGLVVPWFLPETAGRPLPD